MNRLVLSGCVGGLVLVFVAFGATAEDVQQSKTSRPDAISEKAFRKNWPSFRGANSVGQATDATPLLKWNAEDGTGILWKIALPKHGMRSPIVWEDLLLGETCSDSMRSKICNDLSR